MTRHLSCPTPCPTPTPPKARVDHPAVIIVGTHYDLLTTRADHEYLEIQLKELSTKYHIPPYHPGVLQNWKEAPAEGGMGCDGVSV